MSFRCHTRYDAISSSHNTRTDDLVATQACHVHKSKHQPEEKKIKCSRIATFEKKKQNQRRKRNAWRRLPNPKTPQIPTPPTITTDRPNRFLQGLVSRCLLPPSVVTVHEFTHLTFRERFLVHAKFPRKRKFPQACDARVSVN